MAGYGVTGLAWRQCVGVCNDGHLSLSAADGSPAAVTVLAPNNINPSPAIFILVLLAF